MDAYYRTQSSRSLNMNHTATAPACREHCIRCHKDFSVNYPSACVVPHVFDSRCDPLRLYSGEFQWMSECCGGYGTVTEEGPGSGTFRMMELTACYRGPHTTYKDAVRLQYNGVSILRCRHNGSGKCIRNHLTQRNKPVFDKEVVYCDGDEQDRHHDG
ncbi:hypothetical protein BDR04DRAFT_1094336 [Suillus decipiens]|nr:hypothetical protein BDR04DRAFT_1094336 [Suillus decipiens]